MFFLFQVSLPKILSTDLSVDTKDDYVIHNPLSAKMTIGVYLFPNFPRIQQIFQFEEIH